MNVKITALFILYIALSSCHSKSIGFISSELPVNIDLSPNSKSKSLVDQVKDVKVISLQTVDQSIISQGWSIQRILSVDSNIILLDNKYMSIKVFSSSGRFLYNIGSLGNGRGQFVKIDDIFYSPRDKALFVLCNSPCKMIEFTLYGKVIKETSLTFFASSFAKQSPNSFIFYVNQNKSPVSGSNNVLLTDSLFHVITKMYPMPHNIKETIKFSGGIYRINESIYFNPALRNIYYMVKADTLMPKFKLEFGNRKIPNEIPEDKLLSNLKNYGFQYNSFVKTKNFIGFNFHGNGVMSAFYNMKNGTVLTSDLNKDSLNILFSNLLFQDGNTMISVLDLNRLASFLLKNKAKVMNRFPNFFENIKILKTSQNPALIFYKIKTI